MPKPSDFAILQEMGWYRIPQEHAPKGLFAEYYAFYFGRHFGEEKWSIRYYAPRLGHELLTRRALFPNEPDHPQADAPYYKVQLGPLQTLPHPISSLQWRRITFIHTTWDRFMDATEINDLFVEGGNYVDRQYATLHDGDVETGQEYKTVPHE
ncbi:MAG: hypothetical protein HC804_14135 [Anaerolineae bacterium]|nr:hypothetical protein [Anaerolineae bacterium]